MSVANLNGTEADSDCIAPVVEEIEALAREFGADAVRAAVMQSSLAKPLSDMGGSVSRVLQIILLQIVCEPDTKFAAEIMAMACGVEIEEGRTVTSLAKKYGVTKQAVSKRIVLFAERLQLPPSIYMRPVADREIYRLCNKPRTH